MRLSAGARRAAGRLCRRGILAGAAILLGFPFYWMLITTFKQTADLYNLENNPFLFRETPTLEHLRYLFGETLFLRWLGNTAFAGALVVVITLAAAVPAAYALARLTGRWGGRLGIGIFLTYLVPPTLLFIPMSRIVASLGLQDSLWAVILVYPSFTIPFSTWLLMGFFKSIPRDLEDAAMVDGLTRFQSFLKLAVPGRLLRDPDGRHLRVHARHAGIRLCAHFHLHRLAPDGRRRRADLPGAGGRLLLGLPDGGLPHREPADGDPLQPVPRPLHRRIHGRGGEVTRTSVLA